MWAMCSSFGSQVSYPCLKVSLSSAAARSATDKEVRRGCVRTLLPPLVQPVTLHLDLGLVMILGLIIVFSMRDLSGNHQQHCRLFIYKALPGKLSGYITGLFYFSHIIHVSFHHLGLVTTESGELDFKYLKQPALVFKTRHINSFFFSNSNLLLDQDVLLNKMNKHVL